ncbi:MAG: 30S ribosomal protein S3 [Candidatus Staskawiczbacteria bacterium]|nr:30S ribosomal protein S3 [Candidatus Staskawiczbacteria bacterium]
MTHKVHPKSFRIRGTEDWNIRGFYGKKMSQFLQEDFLIKDFLRKKLVEASVANIEIEHSASKLGIIIETARPGIIIGRGGSGAEVLRQMVEKKIFEIKTSGTKRPASAKASAGREVKIEIKEIKNPWISAPLVAQWAAQQIERRVPFRQVLKRSIERVMGNKEAKGVRVELSGRLNGVEIARKEWLREGRLPKNTIRADIDYSQTEAHCTYGAIGVKVWIYKGEKFD